MNYFQKKPLLLVTVGVAIIPVLVHMVLLHHFTMNVPYYDDFLWAITFLKEHQSLSFKDKFFNLFGQHNQHRMFWLRLVIATITKLKGYLDFKTLIIIGNLGFLGLNLLFVRILTKLKLPVYYLIPIPFIIHDLSSYHNMVVSYGVPNMTVIFFAILSFYWSLSTQKGRIWLGLAIGILGTFTNGSGILILPIGILGLLISQKPNKNIFVYTLATVISFSMYFNSYQTNLSEISISWKTLPYFIAFMGSYFPFANNALAQLCFVGFFLFAIVVSFRNLPTSKLNIFIALSTTFLIASGLLATLFRLMHDLPIPNWYFIYSYAFVAIIYIWLLYNFKEKTRRFFFFLLFTGLSFYTYAHDLQHNLVQIKGIHSSLQADTENYHRHENWSFIPLKSGIEEVTDWQNNFDILYQSELVKLPAQKITSQPVKFEELKNLDITNTVDSYNISFENMENEEVFYSESLAFLIHNNTKVYFAGMYHHTNSHRQKLKYKKWFNAQGVSVIGKKQAKESFPAGKYKCGIYLKGRNGSEKWLLSDQEIEIENW